MNVRNHTVCWNLLVKATTATEKVAVEKVAVYIYFFFSFFFSCSGQVKVQTAIDCGEA